MRVLLIIALMTVASFARAANLKDSVVLYMSLDKGGNSAVDSSKKGNDGKIFGTNLVAGKINKAFEWSKLADYIEISNFKGLTNAKEFSVAAWVKLSQNAKVTILCGISDDQVNRWNFAVRVNEVFHTNTHRGGWASELNINKKFVQAWHHVAGTYGEGGKARILYYDGEEASRDALFQGELTLTKIRVGRGQSNFDNWPYLGLIDEVALFDRALNKGEIQEVMKGMSSILAVSPTSKLATTWGEMKSRF
jgi:hypothetical protein